MTVSPEEMISTLIKHCGIQVDLGKFPNENNLKPNVESISKAFSKKGFSTTCVQSELSNLHSSVLPALVEVSKGCWVVIDKILADSIEVVSFNGERERINIDSLKNQWVGNTITLNKVRDTDFGFGWLFSAFFRHKKVVFQLFMATLTLQVFALVTPFFFQVVVDKIIVHKNIDTLVFLTGGMLLVAVFDVTLSLLRNYIFYHTIARIDGALGSKVFHKLMSLPFSHFANSSVGKTMTHVRELENISEFLNDSTVTMIIDLAFTLVLIGVMYLYSPTLTIVVIGSIVLYVVLLSLNVPAFFKNLERQFSLGARNNSFLVENVSGIETIKSLGVEKNVANIWDTFFSEFIQTNFKGKMIQARGVQGVELISKVTTILVLYFGAKFVIDGELSIGQLIAFSMLTSNIMMPVIRLAHLWQGLQKARVAVSRLAEILNVKEESGSRSVSIIPSEINGKIELKNIDFSYLPEGPNTLTDMSVTIEPGEVIGVVGRSGSGKSTIVRLLQKLYEPTNGQILLDGYELSMIDTHWLRTQVGVVLQDSVLFATTIRNNIAMGNPNLTPNEIVDVAKMVGAHDFIMGLPHGYDTFLEERGGNLSGGQRQRIAIARALATDPKILIFDEATSALDSESEAVIQNSMKQICSGRTVIIIAHRFSTIRAADRIMALEKGQIVEQGTHQELCQLGGIYSMLYKQQIRKEQS